MGWKINSQKEFDGTGMILDQSVTAMFQLTVVWTSETNGQLTCWQSCQGHAHKRMQSFGGFGSHLSRKKELHLFSVDFPALL